MVELAIRANYDKPGYGQRCADYASGQEHDGHGKIFDAKPDEYTEEQSEPHKEADIGTVCSLAPLTYLIGEFCVERIYLQ